MLHLALCITDSTGDYYKHSLVTLLSVLEHTKSAVTAHIVHDNTLSDAARTAFLELCARYGQTVAFHDIATAPGFAYANEGGKYSDGCLFRLALQDLVQAEKVLYLDSDIVCTLDVRELYDTDMGEAYMAAVREGPLGREQPRPLERLKIRSGAYVNSGVLLMHLGRLRRDFPDFPQRIMAIVKEGGFVLPDQDALNIFFDGMEGAVHFVPDTYNYMIGLPGRHLTPLSQCWGKIIHFTTYKPWEASFKAGLFYWRYYARLFPGEDCFERIVRLEDCKYDATFFAIIKNPKAYRWLRRLWEYAELGGKELLLSRVFPRRRKKLRWAR